MDSQETKVCKYCGSEIPKNAKVCPHCRKKQSHKVRNTILIILGILVLLVLLFSCMGGGGSSSDTTTSSSNSTTTTETEQSTPSTYTVGQTADVNGVDVTLNSAYQTTELDVNGLATAPSDGTVFLVLNWTVVNNSDSDVTVTQSSFESYADNATAQFSGYSIMIDGAFTSDLTLAAGRETSGNIVYEIPAGWQLFETQYKPNMFLDDSADFELTPSQVS